MEWIGNLVLVILVFVFGPVLLGILFFRVLKRKDTERKEKETGKTKEESEINNQ
jgi:hypothetical protein